jgi:hypothetical protein
MFWSRPVAAGGAIPHMFHDGQRQLQDQFDTRRLAEHCFTNLVRDFINPKQKAFIESADMFFLATVDDQGRPTCSYKGGEPGFVRVIDDKTLAVPNYDGDGKYLSWGNTLKNPNIAMIFIDFMKGWRLRIHGLAEVHQNDPLLSEYPESQFIVRIKIREIFGWWSDRATCRRRDVQRQSRTGRRSRIGSRYCRRTIQRERTHNA